MNSFMSWIGGKKALRDEIISRFPTDYKRYIEVFGGGGWVLFHKNPGNDFEVYNDRNPNLANLYRCVRDHPDELISELTYALNSRTDFDYIRKIMKTPTEIPDVKRAAYFYQYDTLQLCVRARFIRFAAAFHVEQLSLNNQCLCETPESGHRKQGLREAHRPV